MPWQRGTSLRRRRLYPSFTASALLHLLLLAAAIWFARQRIEAPPEWVPPATMQMLFQGGAPKNPQLAAPHRGPQHELPAPAPSAPAPSAAAAKPAAPTPPPQPAAPEPPQPPAPPESIPPAEAAPAMPPPWQEPTVRVPLPMFGTPLPEAPPAPPARAAPAPRRPALPRRPAFPAPMAFSLGTPAEHAGRPAPERVGRGVDISLGHGVLSSADAKIFGRGDSKQVGPDWFNEFESWWERHGYYPPQAGENGEQGVVTLDLVIRRDGQVQSVRLASPSGSQWLDMAALSVFRNAHLPALSSQNAAAVPLHLTIHYNIVGR